MGKVSTHPPVKYFCAVTFAPEVNPDEVLAELESVFSAIEIRSDVFNFSDFTDYYRSEMGRELKKLFVVFASIRPAEELSSAKLQTNSLEEKWQRGGKRGDLRHAAHEHHLQGLVEPARHRAAHGGHTHGGVEGRYAVSG